MSTAKPDPIDAFAQERRDRTQDYAADTGWREQSLAWLHRAFQQKYMYNFDWLGRPIIQTPIDMVGTQELIWRVRPDLVIETGVAHGGSLVFSASLLALMDMCDAIEAGTTFDPRAARRKVIGVDIDIRAHNRAAIEAHPMSSRIHMIQGSSLAPDVVDAVRQASGGFTRVMVFLDSNHTHEHVRAELDLYAPMTTVGSYCVVFDTIVEDMPEALFHDRPWGPGDNPKTAVWDFVRTHPEFEIDRGFEQKLMITVAPDGYLKRVS